VKGQPGFALQKTGKVKAIKFLGQLVKKQSATDPLTNDLTDDQPLTNEGSDSGELNNGAVKQLSGFTGEI
jgi:hypothetical protein